jgi:hypothetical protein
LCHFVIELNLKKKSYPVFRSRFAADLFMAEPVKIAEQFQKAYQIKSPQVGYDHFWVSVCLG